MKSIVRFCSIWIFLCIGYSVNAQRIDLFYYPDSLYHSGEFKLAASEYERIFFMAVESETKDLALLNKSFCYKQDKQYNNAAKTLKRIDFNKVNDSVYRIACYEYALNSYLNGDYVEAMLQLDEMRVKNFDTLNNPYLILKIITLNELNKWEDANITLEHYITLNKINVDANTNKDLMKKPRLKNEKLAKGISYFIPGSGQIYSGHMGRGLSSLLFTAAFAAYSYVSFVDGFYYSSVFTGFSGFRTFWSGGASYAAYLANQKNIERINAHNKKVKDFIFLYDSNILK